MALPLVVSTAFWSLQWFIDRMFLMWHSEEAMSAALPAGMLHWTMVCLPMGIASYATTFVAQYHGAGRPQQIGLAVAQGVRFGWLTTPLFLLSIPLAPWIFRCSAPSEAVFQLEVTYFQWLALGAGAVVLSNGISSFYTGRGLTRTVMLVNVSGTLVNIVLDYGLIFGAWGLPQMGIAGAALATTIANWFNVVVFWILMRRPADRETYGLDLGNRFDWSLMRRLLRFGGPSGLPMLIEGMAFTLLTMFVTQISTVAAAATALAFNVNAVAFIPVYGIGIAVSALVGQYLGAGKEELAERATWTALIIAGGYTAVFGLLYVGVPQLFLLPHAMGASEEDFAQVRDLTIVLLRFVAGYCMFDAMQVIFVGALKGAGDTRFVLLVASVLSVVSISVGAFGQHYLGWQLLGWWWVMTAWIFALGMCYLARFMQGRWKSMRVIEPEIDDDAVQQSQPAYAQVDEV